MTDKTAFKRPTLRSHPRIWLRRLFRSWTVLVWLAIALLTVYLATTRTQYGEILGVIETVADSAAPLEAARLVAVHVTPGQSVKKGDILATMDTSLVDAELRVVDAEMNMGIAEAREALASYQRGMMQLAQRAESEIASAEIALEEARVQQACDIAELAELKKEQQRREDLFAKHLVGEELVAALRPSIAALEIASLPAMLQVQTNRLAQARQALDNARVSPLMGCDAKAISEALREKIAAVTVVAESNRGQIQSRRETYVLRATRDGTVSEVLHQPGVVVVAADPVVRVVANPDHVVGFLPEIRIRNLAVGKTLSIIRCTHLGKPVAAVVESIGPEVQALPGRVSPIPGQTVRGRRFLVKLADGHDFLAGETVTISDTKPFWTHFGEQFSRFINR